MSRLVRIIIDEDVAPGTFRVVGVRVVPAPTDEQLGRELRTKEVHVHDEAMRDSLRDALTRDGFEVVEPE